MFKKLGKTVGNLFDAIWKCIKAVGEAFWNVLKIIWYAFKTYIDFIEAIFDGVLWLIEQGIAKIITIFIPPETEGPVVDPDAQAVADAIISMMGRGTSEISVKNLKSIRKKGAYMGAAVNVQTGEIIPNKNGQQFTFTHTMGEEIAETARQRGFAITGA